MDRHRSDQAGGERAQKLLGLKDALAKRVIGQDQALSLVSDAILRSKAQIQDEDRPIGSFLFLGPTGVGKTELAKALAEQLFDSETHYRAHRYERIYGKAQRGAAESERLRDMSAMTKADS